MDNIGVFGTFGRKTLAIMLICIGDGIRDSLIIIFYYSSSLCSSSKGLFLEEPLFYATSAMNGNAIIN